MSEIWSVCTECEGDIPPKRTEILAAWKRQPGQWLCVDCQSLYDKRSPKGVPDSVLASGGEGDDVTSFVEHGHGLAYSSKKIRSGTRPETARAELDLPAV